MHFLLFLTDGAQFDTVQLIDSFISAEISDPSVEGSFDCELYNIVTKILIHQLCGDYNPASPCMKLKCEDCQLKCSKGFSKPFIE